MPALTTWQLFMVCLHQYTPKQFNNKKTGTFLVVQRLKLHAPNAGMQGVWVWCLVRKLRSHMLCGAVKKKKEERKSVKPVVLIYEDQGTRCGVVYVTLQLSVLDCYLRTGLPKESGKSCPVRRGVASSTLASPLQTCTHPSCDDRTIFGHC